MYKNITSFFCREIEFTARSAHDLHDLSRTFPGVKTRSWEKGIKSKSEKEEKSTTTTECKQPADRLENPVWASCLIQYKQTVD